MASQAVNPNTPGVGGNNVRSNADSTDQSDFETGIDANWAAPAFDEPNPLFEAPAMIADPASSAGAAGLMMIDGIQSGTTNATTGSNLPDQSQLAVAANLATTKFGVTGAGIKIGILSDSFNVRGGEASDIANGYLPAASNIHILRDGVSGDSDEGRAMAQLVHSIAPGARIYFYSGDSTEADMGAGIAALKAAGCQIISDDLTYFDEPFYQMGDPIENAIDAAVAGGASYFSSAANAGANSFYEHNFVGVSTALPGVGTVTAYNFGTATKQVFLEPVTLSGGQSTLFELQWAQPWKSIGAGAGSAYSLAIVVYDSTKAEVSMADVSETGENPINYLQYTPPSDGTYYFAVYVNGGTDPGQQFKVIINNDSTPPVIQDPNAGIGSGSAWSHNIDPNAITVGAVDEADTPANGGTLQSEDFSSSGPGELLFDPDGKPLPAPVSLDKTNISGPDGNLTSVFYPFFGTSAATPVVAAVGGLMLQANPTLDEGYIEEMLEATTLTFGTPDVAGAGLAQATDAVALAEESDTLLRDNFFGASTSALLFQNTDGSVAEWRVNGPSFSNAAVIAGVDGAYSSPGSDWHVRGAGDFGLSPTGVGAERGVSDILLQNDNGSIAVWIMSGSTRSSDVNLALSPGPTWTLIEAGDFNDDGQSDLLLQKTDGSVAVWLMNGTTIGPAAVIAYPGTSWRAVGVGDVNKDGYSDILFQSVDGSIAVWEMNGLSLMDGIALPASLDPGSTWAFKGAGDFNGDDISDFVFQNVNNGDVAIWEMNGPSTLLAAAIVGRPGAAWRVDAIGDYTGNGLSDLALQNQSTGAIEIWIMNGLTIASTAILAENPGTSWHPTFG